MDKTILDLSESTSIRWLPISSAASFTALRCSFFVFLWRSAIFLSISQDSLPSTPRMFLCRGSVISLDDWWSLLAMSGSMSMPRPPRWVCRENSLLSSSLMFTLPQIAVINLNSSNHFHNCCAIPNRIVFLPFYGPYNRNGCSPFYDRLVKTKC